MPRAFLVHISLEKFYRLREMGRVFCIFNRRKFLMNFMRHVSEILSKIESNQNVKCLDFGPKKIYLSKSLQEN